MGNGSTHGASSTATPSQPQPWMWATLCASLLAPAMAEQTGPPPFRYVWARAFHVLPETNSYESGYFSLVDGIDGRMYVGTAFYQRNSFLVEFDPATESQRIVIDTHRLCGLRARGYAAQAKIHTRNFVGPSGRVYCGSMYGERLDGDAASVRVRPARHGHGAAATSGRPDAFDRVIHGV